MKVRDLIILTFPNGGDAEVTGGGKALYDKYKRKHALPVTGSQGKLEANEKAPEGEGNAAGRVWLMTVNHASDDPTAKVLEGTHPFDGKALRPETGIYLVFHAQEASPTLFGKNYLNLMNGPSDPLANWENNQKVQAQKMVGIFKNLGIAAVQKICLVACKTVQGTASEKKAFLESFVIELHQNGYHPMVAGWDIPIDVIADEASPDYGRKKNTEPKGKLLKEERKTHKFVYVYRSSETTFKMPATDAAKQDKRDMRVDKEVKDIGKNLPGQAVMLANTLQKQVTAKGQDDKKREELALKLDFVQRTKYAASGWSG